MVQSDVHFIPRHSFKSSWLFSSTYATVSEIFCSSRQFAGFCTASINSYNMTTEESPQEKQDQDPQELLQRMEETAWRQGQPGFGVSLYVLNGGDQIPQQ